jgi:hypothetical protein
MILALFELNDENSILLAVEFESLTLFQSTPGFVELLDPAHILISWIQLMSRISLQHPPRQDIMELVV